MTVTRAFINHIQAKTGISTIALGHVFGVTGARMSAAMSNGVKLLTLLRWVGLYNQTFQADVEILIWVAKGRVEVRGLDNRPDLKPIEGEVGRRGDRDRLTLSR